MVQDSGQICTRDLIVSLLYFCIGCNLCNFVRYLVGDYRTYRPLGVWFDVAFGVETGLNLLGDLRLLHVLQPECDPNVEPRNPARAALILGRFVTWNIGTTIFCHATSIAAAKFRTDHMRLDLQPGQDEATLRNNYFIAGILFYSIVAGVKGMILYGLHNYRKAYEKRIQRQVETQQGLQLPLSLLAETPILIIHMQREIHLRRQPSAPAGTVAHDQRQEQGPGPNPSAGQLAQRPQLRPPLSSGPETPPLQQRLNRRAVALLQLLRLLAIAAQSRENPASTRRRESAALSTPDRGDVGREEEAAVGTQSAARQPRVRLVSPERSALRAPPNQAVRPQPLPAAVPGPTGPPVVFPTPILRTQAPSAPTHPSRPPSWSGRPVAPQAPLQPAPARPQ